jgi:hypothetical protein
MSCRSRENRSRSSATARSADARRARSTSHTIRSIRTLGPWWPDSMATILAFFAEHLR